MQLETQTYSVAVQSDVMVSMRDGVRLATDIYLPAQGGQPVGRPFPVLLERTPYGKGEASRSEIDLGGSRPFERTELASFFVSRGYVVVYQDCRGRYGSEGAFVKYLAEAADGEDTLRWMAEQPWFNGQVATMGLSYAAHTQLALACHAPPGLATMVLDSGGLSNAYQCGIRQGGAFELKQVTWAFNQAREAMKDDPVASLALEREDLKEWFQAMPWRPGHSPLRWAPAYEDYVFEQWKQGSFSAYWKQWGIHAAGAYDKMADIPQVHMSSWYDVYVRSTLENYTVLSRKHQSPVRLIMGPWLHGDRNLTYAGNVEFGPAASFDGNIAPSWRAFRLAWFDHCLKGVANGVEQEPAVRLFLMGGGSGHCNAQGRLEHGGRWIASTDWPMAGTRFVEHYFQSDGSLSPQRPLGEEGSLTYDFDPKNPVPTIGGALTSGKPIFDGGAFDQKEDERFFGAQGHGLPLAARPDVLVFQTPLLEHDTAVIGPVIAHLWVSSNCPDTDFTVKLIDVYPPSLDYPQGFAMNLTDGILRCRYRNSWEAPEPMVTQEVYEITIECFATANLFKAGHRIRIDVSSSNFPKYDVNPNTGAPEGSAGRKAVATNTLFVNNTYASHIVLPLVPVASISPLP